MSLGGPVLRLRIRIDTSQEAWVNRTRRVKQDPVMSARPRGRWGRRAGMHAQLRTGVWRSRGSSSNGGRRCRLSREQDRESNGDRRALEELGSGPGRTYRGANVGSWDYGEHSGHNEFGPDGVEPNEGRCRVHPRAPWGMCSSPANAHHPSRPVSSDSTPTRVGRLAMRPRASSADCAGVH
ncbi:hypothetical protein BV20DRAFT_290594 [Pilatotrama ljubarskyi]|nr:hypothetical protein BV20DRAFT_290594 [Pilatotrama ljubarskyi]